MDAFDADVLIYAAVDGHVLGGRIRHLFLERQRVAPDSLVGVGSVLLLPELLTKPLRDGASAEVAELGSLLGRLELRPVDSATAQLATVLGAAYSLRAADAIHLATAVGSGAQRFVTNNKRDFGREIGEIDVTYPEDLDEPTVS